MKTTSIKKKMVLWYAFVLLVIFALVFASLLIGGDKLARDSAKANLVSSTDRTLKDVRVINGKLHIDDDVSYYNNGAYIIVYKDDGTVVSGLEMEGYEGTAAFEADRVREIRQRSTSFYVYDRLLDNEKTGRIWVRGMCSADLDVLSPAVARMIRMVGIIIPVIILLALLGGYIISRRAFQPLKAITKTAQKIHNGKDLSMRIDIDQDAERDEVTQTAIVFNEMLDDVEKRFEAEKRFTNDASHELRTPTAVILSQAEYALDNLDDREEVKDSLTTIVGQSKKLVDLLNKLLMIARADGGRLILNHELIDLSLTAELCAQHHRRMAEEKDISITVEADESYYLHGDTALIERMLDNLISNAIKYGRTSGKVMVRVEEKDEKHLALTVSDNGMGISPERLPHIWERFYTAEETRNDASVGLGLPIVKWIVEAHGGTIDVTSEEKVGTKFFIILPVSSSSLNVEPISSDQEVRGND